MTKYIGNRQEDLRLIEEHIEKHGVTKCPPAIAKGSNIKLDGFRNPTKKDYTETMGNNPPSRINVNTVDRYNFPWSKINKPVINKEK